MPHSDTDDLARWRKDKDAGAFQQIINRYSGLVFEAGRRITGNSQDAEDITQRCFLKLAESPPSIKHSLAGWLHRAATNLAINHVRKEQSRKAREEKYQSLSPDSHEAVWDELQDTVDEAIEQLPAKFKEPLLAHYFGGQTHEVISKQMGVSRQTVSYRIDRGVVQIRKFLLSKGHVVGAAALASMLEALTAQPVSTALAQALSKLALSGVAMSTAEQRVSLRALFGNLAFGRKPIRWLTAIAVVAGALAGFMWSSRPAQIQGESKAITGGSVAQRNDLDPVSDRITVASNDNQESSQSSTSANAPDAEAPLIQGMVVHSVSGSPIPNVQILIYPEDAVDFTIEEEKDLADLGGTDREIIESYKAAFNLDSGDTEIPWYMFANRAHFERNRNVELEFETDDRGYFDAESLNPGKYLAIIESTEYSANGYTVLDLGEQGTTAINGYANIEIFEQDDPQAFIIQADPRADLTGRIYDTSTNTGLAQITVRALRRSGPFLSINEGSTVTDVDGAYAFEGLPIGTYTILRDETESFHGNLSAKTNVTFTMDNRVNFPVSKGTVISGTVYWGDVPAADIEFALNYEDGNVSVGTKLVEHQIHTDENGQFLVAGVKSFDGILYGTARLTDNNSIFSNWVQNVSLSEGDFMTVDLKFDIGTASVQGRFTQAGKPLRNTTVIWYSVNVNGMQQRAKTDSDGYYSFELLPPGPAVVDLFFPVSYAGTTRPIDVKDGEQLELDVNLPSGSFTFSVNNLPRRMRNTWVSVFDGDYEIPTSISPRDWITQRRFERKGLARIWPKTPGILRGLPPGDYKFVVLAGPIVGNYPHFFDDPDLLQAYLEKMVLLSMDFEVTSTTNRLVTIDYSEAKPLSNYFSID